MVAEKPRVRRVLGGLMKSKRRRKYMNITIELAIKLYELGTVTICHGGQIYFKKEKSQ